MGWTPYQRFLAVMMVVTGSINTLATKWADTSSSKGVDGTVRKFDHPFLQAVGMFLGEFTCLLTFKLIFCLYQRKQKPEEEYPVTISGNQKFNPFIFLLPALCDMTGTSIMYIGLNLTYASSFQMLRGAVIVFTGLLSVAFLRRVIKRYEWLGILIIIVGLVLVGLSDMIKPDGSQEYSQNSKISGDLLIVIAQIITATQMVVEEKFVNKNNVPPLQAVGWEGFFGFIILSILLVPMYYIPVGKNFFHNPKGNLEDAIDGFYQIANSWQVCLGVCGTVISIAFFNFAGISVTKEISATTRMVLDSIRTLVVWICGMLLFHEKFGWLQLVGFLILLVGMCLYNDIYIRQFWNKLTRRGTSDELDPLLNTENGSINAEK
ncbi:solute carrier family 35 member F6-like [Centruroides vittatus]|uniref:solute carrier family 35 member F6-like n=1 Tax=Centruroides vittatus TaxID=120091 RepID=UPI00350FC84A